MIKKERIAESHDRKIATVTKWRASGLSQAEFCRQEGYQQWQLSDWRRWVENHEKQTQSPPARMRPDRIKRRQKENKGNCSRPAQDREEIATELQPFVPVHLVDAGTQVAEQLPTIIFNSVLELVLKQGQIIRVAPNCPPQFLGAVVATLEH
jgi:hypothetical protein